MVGPWFDPIKDSDPMVGQARGTRARWFDNPAITRPSGGHCVSCQDSRISYIARQVDPREIRRNADFPAAHCATISGVPQSPSNAASRLPAYRVQITIQRTALGLSVRVISKAQG